MGSRCRSAATKMRIGTTLGFVPYGTSIAIRFRPIPLN